MRTPTDDRQGATVVIRMIAKDLRINPLRTSLTALSMFIGIIALIAGVLVGTLGRDYLEAVNARLGGKSPTYSAIVDVPSSVNIQVVTALQERLAHFRPGIASAQYHLNDLAIWASSDDGNTEIRRVTIIITDAERTRIMPAPIIEGTWLTGADEPATLETAVNESARQYVHDGTVALARTGNPQQVPARVNGVIADGTDTPTIYVNATTLQRYWPQAWEPDGLTILVHPNEGVDDQHAKTVLDDLLSDVETGSISSWNRSDNADDYEQVIGFLQLGVTVTAILLLSVSAIGMINGKTTAVRVIPVPGKTVGDVAHFGGLLGEASIIRVPGGDASGFVKLGGRIPAPIHSLRN